MNWKSVIMSLWKLGQLLLQIWKGVLKNCGNSERNISNKRLRFTQERMKGMIVNP